MSRSEALLLVDKGEFQKAGTTLKRVGELERLNKISQEQEHLPKGKYSAENLSRTCGRKSCKKWHNTFTTKRKKRGMKFRQPLD
jgi:hypothetical protein